MCASPTDFIKFSEKMENIFKINDLTYNDSLSDLSTSLKNLTDSYSDLINKRQNDSEVSSRLALLSNSIQVFENDFKNCLTINTFPINNLSPAIDRLVSVLAETYSSSKWIDFEQILNTALGSYNLNIAYPFEASTEAEISEICTNVISTLSEQELPDKLHQDMKEAINVIETLKKGAKVLASLIIFLITVITFYRSYLPDQIQIDINKNIQRLIEIQIYQESLEEEQVELQKQSLEEEKQQTELLQQLVEQNASSSE